MRIPDRVVEELSAEGKPLTFTDRLGSGWSGTAEAALLPASGLALPALPPCSALYLEVD